MKALLLFLLTPMAVWGQSFDIEKHCKDVASFAGGSYQIEQGCRNNERKAQAQMDSETIPAEIKAHCTEVAEFAGGSYQIIWIFREKPRHLCRGGIADGAAVPRVGTV